MEWSRVMTTIRFAVYGEPKPQGSKKSVPIYSRSGPVMKNGRVLTRVVNDNPKLGEWRQELSYAARQAYSGPLLCGPLKVAMTFYRPRPSAHFGSGKNAGVVKASAIGWPISRPDVLKLARAVEDSLTGVLYRDDSQIVDERLVKAWGECFSVEVTVTELGGSNGDGRTGGGLA
jgi:Holliday junction resolvase RusA-like endonuclease